MLAFFSNSHAGTKLPLPGQCILVSGGILIDTDGLYADGLPFMFCLCSVQLRCF